MNWVYILHNPVTDRFYVGSTIDLKRRLLQHRSNNVRTTRRLKAYDLVYLEEFETLDEARLREKKIKAQKSKMYVKKLIDSFMGR